MVIVQYDFNNECGETNVAASEGNIRFMFALTAGYMIYYFVKSNAFPETMMRFTYRTVYLYTKVNAVYKKLTTRFHNMVNRGTTINNSADESSTESFTDYEIRIIKNGIKCEQFETMDIFKESNYLGNPNDYCDSQDEEESQSQSSSTNESCEICDVSVSDSQEGHETNEMNENVDENQTQDTQDRENANTSITTTTTTEIHGKNEQLFIMKHNKLNNTIRFIPYDFVMQTQFSNHAKKCTDNSYNKLNKNYTKLYRQFRENDYSFSSKDLVISNMTMIACSLELNGKTYEIDISFPYNFNVVGNVILDYTFLSWYMLKQYDVAPFATDCDYTLRCISNAVTTYKLRKSSGLLVNLNDYEIITV